MRVPCVGAVIHDAHGRLLVIRRGRPPSEGLWSIPGGRVEPHESLADAVQREVREETGLAVIVGQPLGSVELPGVDGDVYDVTDFAATVLESGAEPVAGDDAAEARWVTRPEFEALPKTPGLDDSLTSWGVWV